MPVRDAFKSVLKSFGASSSNNSRLDPPPLSPNPGSASDRRSSGSNSGPSTDPQNKPTPGAGPSITSIQPQTSPGEASTLSVTPQPASSSSSIHPTRSRSPSVLPTPENELRALAPLRDQCELPLTTIVAELAPIPCIGTLVDGINALFRAVERTKVNTEQWKLLQGRCVMVARIAGAQVTNYGGQHYHGVQDASRLLHDTIVSITQRIEHWNQVDRILAFIQCENISREIASYFCDLDKCLAHFSYAVDVAHVQWIGEFTVVQKEELAELKKLLPYLEGVKTDLNAIGQGQDELKVMTTDIHAMLLQTFSDKSTVLQRPSDTAADAYAEIEQTVRTIRGVTGMELPVELLTGRQCITESKRPITSGTTCDVFSASFLGGVKVAKKVFRVGTCDRENVDKYAQRFLRDAKLWSTFNCDYTLRFLGLGMEELDSRSFQLYMVSPFMKHFDAVTYLREHRSNLGMDKSILLIITDAARGLQYLHEREPPVVHSGMRGNNILITDSGRGMLGGFGLTKVLQDSKPGEKLPTAVMTGKTESQRYMAPEMLEVDYPELKTPCDVWGWAMAALELISGQAPYYQCKQVHLAAAEILTSKKPIRSKFANFEKYAFKPDEMWALLERCWQFEVNDRPPMDQVVGELKAMAR
ncbi:hypothetical protein FRC09_006117 [Ceratobasidium sp. 395]|nr:hypothetical protein FRC09_006117 [Ceratobasidium sp. 395]